MHHHAGLGEGEADEHPHRVEGDQPGHAGVEDHQQQGGTATQGEDAVAEHHAVPQGGQLAGQEAVLGQEGRQAREIGVGGVGGQQQHHRGEHFAGVAPLHRPEGRHAVADRLDAGEGGAAGAERAHQQHGADRH